MEPWAEVGAYSIDCIVYFALLEAFNEILSVRTEVK